MTQDALVNSDAPQEAVVTVFDRVARTQVKYHRWTKTDRTLRFGDLFNLVSHPSYLLVAWEHVARNKGARTAGVDGVTVRQIAQRGEVWQFLQEIAASLKDGTYRPSPVRRVLIPKPGGKSRPLGIPTVTDRVVQQSLRMVLEPIFEADFLPVSYGFRPKRRAHDTVAEIHYYASRGYRWVLDADIEGCFDNIDHQMILDRVRARIKDKETVALVRAFLKAGVLTDLGLEAATATGTPQGGVISPLLMNIALHGMETAAGVRYKPWRSTRGWSMPGTPVVIRYADDLVALCHSRQEAEQVKERLAAWLTPRGLSFNEDKTQIVHLSEGFDFLGFNVRHYRSRGKLLIKPSKAAVKRFRARLRAEVRNLHGTNTLAVISRLNPILRGWAGYYRTVVSKRVFGDIDHTLWWTLFKWGRRQHNTKTGQWIVDRYFGRFNTAKQDRWIFGDRETGAYLRKLSWTPIRRHQMVKADASPDDPALTYYWQQRRRRHLPPDTPGPAPPRLPRRP